MNSQHEHKSMCGKKIMFWTPVLVGALVAIGLSFLLNMLSLSLGMAAFTVSPEGNTVLAVGGFIGLVVGSIITMFVACLIAGRLARPFCFKKNMGELYGLTTWCLALVLTIVLSSYLGSFISRINYAVNPSAAPVVNWNPYDSHAPLVKLDNKTDSNVPDVTANASKTGTLSMVAFVIFFVFFIGALACCFGGRCGMVWCRRDDADKTNCCH